MMTREQMKEMVTECYEEVLRDLSEMFINELADGEPSAPHTSEIIRDWKCCAAEEWEDLTVDEADKMFDELYFEIDAERSLLAQAYA